MDSSRLVRKMAALPKPLLLKDYLLDDMGSCSSNGFKSFPRKQYCCSSVRLIHDFDLKNKQHQKKYLVSNKPSSKSSAFQRVISAMKRLPFAAAKSPEKKISSNYSFLPRSFSKRILKKSGFWKRKSSDDRKEIGRWKSFDQLLKEDAQPSDRSSDSWSGSDVTVSEDYCSSGNSSAEVNLNSPQKRNDVVEKRGEVVTNKGVGATNGDVSLLSTTNSDDTNSSTSTKQKEWSSDEKEQLSPVSVLDCPFDDEDEVSSSSNFQHRLARMEGAKKTLMKKIQRFECLAKLEPVNLATRFALQSDSDNESSSSFTTEDKFVSDIEERENEDENEAAYKALELLHQMPHYDNLKLMHAEKLVLDFFRERIGNDQTVSSLEEELLEEAETWINDRKTRGVFLEWEVRENRQAYVEDMGKCGGWKTLDQENDEVALELETEVFDALLHEVLLEFEGELVVVRGQRT